MKKAAVSVIRYATLVVMPKYDAINKEYKNEFSLLK
jgi:hypothetical protein